MLQPFVQGKGPLLAGQSQKPQLLQGIPEPSRSPVRIRARGTACWKGTQAKFRASEGFISSFPGMKNSVHTPCTDGTSLTWSRLLSHSAPTSLGTASVALITDHSWSLKHTLLIHGPGSLPKLRSSCCLLHSRPVHILCLQSPAPMPHPLRL